jgi:hypothetical protein
MSIIPHLYLREFAVVPLRGPFFPALTVPFLDDILTNSGAPGVSLTLA